MNNEEIKKYLKAGFIVLMAVYGIFCAKDPAGFHYLDRVNLVAHEAGHLLFGYFGEFLMVLGGTLGQLLVPLAFTVYFYLRREFVSSAVTLFWTGQNLFNISVYIKDAQAMDLPLVSVGGGEDTIHDWNYLLSKTGLLRWDQAIGSLAYIMGLMVVAVAVIGGLYYALDLKRKEAVSEDRA